MASITVRNLDDGLKRRLRIRAAENGRSMEQEARDILRAALDEDAAPDRNLGTAIHELFRPFGGVELEIPTSGTHARAPAVQVRAAFMFVLDTNVVSELMRERPNPEVLGWMDNQLTINLFVTSVTEAEIRTGIAILPEGERKRGLATAAERLFSVFFSERILPFDSDAAQAYAMLAAERRTAGRPISQSDCQIAAIARSRGAAVVTRDTGGFEGLGLDVIDPWPDG